MNTSFKPPGYNSLSPYFVVRGAQQLMDQLKEVFSATELRKYPAPDGSLLHAELRIDDTVIMLADASSHYPPQPQIIHVYVADADETFNKALAAGCESLEPPRQKPGDPDRRGTFKDLAGNMWSVATQVENQ